MLANLYKFVKISLQGKGGTDCGNKAKRINIENNRQVETVLLGGSCAPLDEDLSMKGRGLPFLHGGILLRGAEDVELGRQI